MTDTVTILDVEGEREVPVDSLATAMLNPTRIGYKNYSDWARRVHDGYQTAENQAFAEQDYARATYYLMKREAHDREVRIMKSGYTGL